MLGTRLESRTEKSKEQEGRDRLRVSDQPDGGALERRLWTLLQSCSPWSVVRASAASCAIDSCDATESRCVTKAIFQVRGKTNDGAR